MNLSSALCRIQANEQLALAASDPLPNVRQRAAKAAVAWENEALLALKREQKALDRAQGDISAQEDWSGPDPDLPPVRG